MSLNYCYTPNYFSIDDILTTQERTKCKFLMDVPKLGKLNPSAQEDDLKEGTMLELPLWLTHDLLSGRQPVVSTELPKVYKEACRESLKADPRGIDLHQFGIHFYELGAYVKHLDIRGDLSQTLLQTFQLRFRQLMDLADNPNADPRISYRLDTLERRLYQESFAARKKLNNWLIDTDAPLQAAAMVVNHKKRKRIDAEELI